MASSNNTLWEKHRMYLPDMRKKAIHRCKHCKFFVVIQGKLESKNACVVNIKVYGNLEKRVPPVIPIMEIIKRVGLEGLEYCLKFSNPDTQSCGKFELRTNKNN